VGTENEDDAAASEEAEEEESWTSEVGTPWKDRMEHGVIRCSSEQESVGMLTCVSDPEYTASRVDQCERELSNLEPEPLKEQPHRSDRRLEVGAHA